jgi:DNA modification methylase
MPNSNSTDVRSRSWVNEIHKGDAAETLAEMPESSVHMAMCSPPYYGIRDYGVDGQIGLEDRLDEYIASLLDVADELRRVLRDDGSWWLNLGDSFAGSWGGQGYEGETKNQPKAHPDKNPARHSRMRRKSKMLVPHRVAIALEDAGWIVRSDAVWEKPNPMPHPVKDRLHEHKEFVFHLTPEPDYWFDLDAIREPHKEISLDRHESCFVSSGTQSHRSPAESGERESVTMDAEDALHPNGKNPGDVFEIAVKAFPEAHFAVYPPELCERPIKSSCPPTVCAECGTPYERKTEEVLLWERRRDTVDRSQAQRALEKFEQSDLTVKHLKACRATGVKDTGQGQAVQNGCNEESTAELAAEAKQVLGGYVREFYGPARRDDGWGQDCGCETDETEPGIVLDPFAGAGTTCMVAKDLGRRFVGIDLNPEYVAIAQKRVGLSVDEPERLLEDDAQTTLVQADGGRNTRDRDTGNDRQGGDS